MWKPISEHPDFMGQPGRQFICVQGTRDHSGISWHRLHVGEAYIRKPGSNDEMLQYRKSDIERIIKDGDMDDWSARVTHWMPAAFPPLPLDVEH